MLLYKSSDLNCKRQRHDRLCHFVALPVLFVAGAALAGGRNLSARELNGTYRHRQSEIEVFAVGHHKVRVHFALVYEIGSPEGPSANMGDAAGEATIEGDTAVFQPEGSDHCRITLKFLRRGKLLVTQEGDDSECGFGQNVRADGVYRKISGGKPKFEPILGTG